MWPWKSFIHLFIYSLTRKICIPCTEQDPGLREEPASHCPCPVPCVSRATRIPSVCLISEQAQAWGQM